MKSLKFMKIYENIVESSIQESKTPNAKFESLLSASAIPPAMRFNILSSRHGVLERSATDVAACK